MAQIIDLYSILRAYANKSNSPYIEITPFLEFLEKYAKHKVQEAPEWAKWTSDIPIKFWAELSPLAESEKCMLVPDSGDGRIYMPFFCRDQLVDIYKDIENQSDLPFPDESSINADILADQLQIVNPENDMGIFFDEDSRNNDKRAGEADQAAVNPNQIAKILFPNDHGSALVPVSLIPRRLLEISFLKIRHFLRSHGNREYAQHKLSPQLQGREKYLIEILDQIMMRPFDCLRGMEDYGDFAYLFWTYFCSLMKNDIKKKTELLSEDLAAIQSVYIIEACNSLYHARAVKKREMEIAFKNLELCMERAPYYFTIDDIIKFTTDKGMLVLGAYSPQQLDEYIKKRTIEYQDGNLPDWLVLQGPKGERWYIKKIKYLFLCTKLLTGTRPEIKKAITRRWTRLLKEFRSEQAMVNDDDFERLVRTSAANSSQTLIALLDDEKLLWVYEELSRNKEIPASSRIFKNGKLLPLGTLLAFSRKDILSDAKILLPFWYSVPVISAIIAFFKRLGKKRARREEETAANTNGQSGTVTPKVRELQNSARAVGMALVPAGQTLDSFLEDLEGRWSRLLDKNARENLIEDVRTLVRDTLRAKSRIPKKNRVSGEELGALAENIISHNQTLMGLQSRNSLRLYIQLYLAKLLMTFKF